MHSILQSRIGMCNDGDETIRKSCNRASPYRDMHTGSALRWLFAIILLHCYPTSPEVLWNQFKHKICDDLRRRLEYIPAYHNH